jgi:thiosulfate dehydrogenase [quinone] large subunit
MNYSKGQTISVITLRIVIGWHFLYEGLTKLVQPDWSSKAYLMDSNGFAAGFFQWISANPAILGVADFLNEWGLTLIGLSLILGLLSRVASVFGMALLLFYYLSHPAWIGLDYLFPSEGSYFIVNKNIIEIFALLVLYWFPTDRMFGIGLLFKRNNQSISP